jgi:hypothetical protein
MLLSIDVGIKNFGFCVIDDSFKILRWEVGTIASFKFVDIISFLENLNLINECTQVIVEKQPNKNPKMRIIETILLTYFTIKGVMNDDSTIKLVRTYSAKYKLGYSMKKTTYIERKKLGVHMCAQYLEQNKDTVDLHLQDTFRTSKKKDDLADSLLQGLSFMSYDMNELRDSEPMIRSLNASVRPKKPNASQEKKMYSKSNIKYALQNNANVDEQNVSFMKGIKHHYGNVVNAMELLAIPKKNQS